MSDTLHDDIPAELTIEFATLPEGWRELIYGLWLMSGTPSADPRPLHCEHDQLTVCVDPDDFDDERLALLERLGFLHDEEQIYSFRFGSA